MSKALEPMLKELEQESATTRRVLERIPENKLGWKPHAKSMSLGQLALHIAAVPGAIANLAKNDVFDLSQANFNQPAAANKAEIFTAFDSSVKSAVEYLAGVSESSASGNWCAKFKEKELFTMTRAELLRSIMLNHWYHHRGQLSVYLRMLDVDVPSIYGPSADENPFV
jgi:uncharacterized damage-inducible protein DinB